MGIYNVTIVIFGSRKKMVVDILHADVWHSVAIRVGESIRHAFAKMRIWIWGVCLIDF